ncbi:hypothetical protein WJX79_010572 [Trebouxia sp. C0005]
MAQSKGRLPTELPFLPLYNQVLLPGAFARVHFERSGPVSGPLLEYLLAQHGEQVLVAAVSVLEADKSKQIDNTEDADSAKLKNVATAARVLQVSRNTQTGAWVVTLEGWCRVYLEDAPREGRQKFLLVTVEQAGPSKDMRLKDNDLDKEGQELADALHAGTGRLAGLLNHSVGSPATGRLAELLQKLSPPAAADVLASMLTRDTAFKQLVLEAVDHNERMRLVVGLIQRTLDSVQGRAKQSGDDSQQQLTIPPRLQLLPPSPFKGVFKGGANGPEEEEEEELSALMQRIKAAKPPAEVLKVASREYRRLKKSNEHHPGHAMSRAYLETLADLPWNTFSGETQAPSNPEAPQGEKARATEEASDADSTQADASREELPDGEPMAQAASEPTSFPRPAAQLSLHEARDLLDKDHYGLDKVKDRIVQYLAVRRLRGADARAPILCFVGPPGTGKTSLASSISKVLLRPFQRVSVGGVRDEAEIRGHRRTYIGAMPGRIIQAVRRSSVRDPVLLLDEVDKMGHDSLRGDPASALLEVLDPNQNQAFVDTYLSVPFDLSQVVFVATANQLQNMSAPLLDRLEIIQLSGYTLDEKRHIAQRHLIPGLLGEHGLTSDQLHFPAEAILLIADGYTREAGVRSLSRSLAAICRHVTVKIVSEQDSLHEQPATSTHPDDNSHDLPDQPQAASLPVQHQHQHQHEHEHAAQYGRKQLSGSSHQQPLPTSGEPVRSAMEQELASPTTATSGGFFWGSLWGGLKGAFTPPRQHPSGRQHQLPHSKAVQRQSQTGQQTQHDGRRPADHEVTHPAPEYATSGGHQHQTHSSKRIPHTRAGSSRTAGSSDGKGPLSNPYGGVNADMSRSGHAEVACLTVTAELIEEVLGPRKYNETDSADSLVSPGSAAGLVWTAVGGITLATAMVSLFLGRCARADTAMTGELTLRGLVLPIGGLKEKLLAAHHAGIKRVLVPKRNWRDVKADVPDNIRSSLEIIPVHVLEDVLQNAFEPPLMLRSIAKL